MLESEQNMQLQQHLPQPAAFCPWHYEIPHRIRTGRYSSCNKQLNERIPVTGEWNLLWWPAT
jgi:hypothetical protein